MNITPNEKKCYIRRCWWKCCIPAFDMSTGVSGETHHVDCGYHVVGMKAIDARHDTS